MLRGGTVPRGPLFWHFPQYQTAAIGPRGAVRDRHWKLIEDYTTGAVLLYDLANDSGEQRDLSSCAPARAAVLQRRLAAWRQQVGARMPTRRDG
ncbi:MAG: hypothetical protein JNK49_05985 [Planctomycetes bacterium]|nr:hypothetical protein [Planctomycetota bacterium]